MRPPPPPTGNHWMLVGLEVESWVFHISRPGSFRFPPPSTVLDTQQALRDVHETEFDYRSAVDVKALDGGVPRVANPFSSIQRCPLWKDFPNRFFCPTTVIQSGLFQMLHWKRTLVTSHHAVTSMVGGVPPGWRGWLCARQVCIGPLCPSLTQTPWHNNGFHVKSGNTSYSFLFLSIYLGIVMPTLNSKRAQVYLGIGFPLRYLIYLAFLRKICEVYVTYPCESHWIKKKEVYMLHQFGRINDFQTEKDSCMKKGFIMGLSEHPKYTMR